MRRRDEREAEARAARQALVDAQCRRRRPAPAPDRRRRRSGCCARRWRPGFSNHTLSPGSSSVEPIRWNACCAPPTMKICSASQSMPRFARRCDAIAWRRRGSPQRIAVAHHVVAAAAPVLGRQARPLRHRKRVECRQRRRERARAEWGSRCAVAEALPDRGVHRARQPRRRRPASRARRALAAAAARPAARR